MNEFRMHGDFLSCFATVLINTGVVKSNELVTPESLDAALTAYINSIITERLEDYRWEEHDRV